MKICLISNLFNPDLVGGAENVVGDLADRLAAEGHDVLVVATKLSEFVQITEAMYQPMVGIQRFYPENVYRAFRNEIRAVVLKPVWHLLDAWNPHSFFYVRRMLKKFSPDIVNTHNIFGMSTAVWSAARALNLPVVHTLYDYSLVCPKTTRYKNGRGICKSLCFGCRMYSVPKRSFTETLNAVIFPSQHLLDSFQGYGMFRKTKNYIIPHGVAVRTEKEASEPGAPNFLCIGQVSEYKGILTLLKAFRTLPSQKAVLNIVGVGEALRKAEKMAADDPRVIFHHFVSAQTKRGLFRNASVVVLPSLWEEPHGQAIVEAYSYGIPVIASSVGANTALVDYGVTGFLVQAGSVQDLAQKMHHFVHDTRLTAALSENCLKKAQNFSLDFQVKKYCEIYEEVLASSRGVSRQ